MRDMVEEAVSILVNENLPIKNFGQLLHNSWQIKRTLSDLVSPPQIDLIYQTACDHGAIGGKLLGAGGGGFMLFFAEPHRQSAIREALSSLVHVGFQFETTGSTTIFSKPMV